MNDDREIEEALRGFRHDSDPQVKRAVLSAYDASLGAGERQPRGVGFWRRPIPLYAAAMALLLVASLSFITGQHTSGADTDAGGRGRSAPADSALSSVDVEWSTAASDLL